MYNHNSRQMEFVEFKSPFGDRLRADNRWVKIADAIPWEIIEEQYTKSLSSATRGQKAYSSRVAFGALFIKEQIGLTDENTVLHIQENPYLQYFIGFREYEMEAPFDPSLMTHFRKRFPEESIREIDKTHIPRISKALFSNFSLCLTIIYAFRSSG